MSTEKTSDKVELRCIKSICSAFLITSKTPRKSFFFCFLFLEKGGQLITVAQA